MFKLVPCLCVFPACFHKRDIRDTCNNKEQPHVHFMTLSEQ